MLTAKTKNEGAEEEPVGAVAAIGAFGGEGGMGQEEFALQDHRVLWERMGAIPPPVHCGTAVRKRHRG